MRKGAAANFYWVIEGFDGAKRIYSEKVRSTLISIPKMKELLACLAARAGLDYGEIVDCHTIRNARRHRSHLEVHDDAIHHTLRCGSNPHFAARIVRAPECE
jgi:hypothetical protein